MTAALSSTERPSAFAGSPPRIGPAVLGLFLAIGLGHSAMAQPATAAASSAGIYTCLDDKGRKLTSDRPIPECTAKEQRVLNRDGSLRRVLPPTMTADERAELESAERRAALQRAATADAVRRDRNLMLRFPNEAEHRKARESALNTVRAAILATETRQKELAAARKPLEEEAEFYKGKQMPARLRQQLDANDAAVDAQRSAVLNQQSELVRINSLYDDELGRLRRLWSGVQPGSLPSATALSGAAASGASPVNRASASTPR